MTAPIFSDSQCDDEAHSRVVALCACDDEAHSRVMALCACDDEAHSRVVALCARNDENMIVGIGTDLAEVSRIAESIARFGDRFLNRIYTDGERKYAQSKANAAERFAARFAAKEAGMKAIGTGWNFGVTWRDFEVVNQRSGRPMLVLHGKAQEIAGHLGADRVSISLTHTKETAFAVVILESSA